LVLIRRERREALWVYRADFALRGFLEITFMVSKLTALQFLQAPYVVGIQRLSLFWSILGARFFFQEPDFGRRLAAGSLILAGVLLILWA
jgi:drug/metabolite transporter (DMT)-like permease